MPIYNSNDPKYEQRPRSFKVRGFVILVIVAIIVVALVYYFR